MRIEEAFVVAAPREEVWRHITDPRQVGLCLPGCKAIEVMGPALYKAAIEVGVGPIKTTFKIEVEVEVNETTGQVRVAQGWCAHDVGRVINHDGVRGQITGGFVPGVGGALFEELVWDAGRHGTSRAPTRRAQR